MLMLALIRNKKMLVDRWPQKTGFVFAKNEIKSASMASANQLLPCPNFKTIIDIEPLNSCFIFSISQFHFQPKASRDVLKNLLIATVLPQKPIELMILINYELHPNLIAQFWVGLIIIPLGNIKFQDHHQLGQNFNYISNL